jgi:hypothetical protein
LSALRRAWSGLLLVWVVWIPLALTLMATNPQGLPDWSAPVILFGWWPAAFALGWRHPFV